MLESVLLSSSSVSASKQLSIGNNTQQQQVAINNSTQITTTNNTYSGTPDTPVIANGTNRYSSIIKHSFNKYNSHLPTTMESTVEKESADVGRCDSRIPAVRKAEPTKSHGDDNKQRSDKINKKSISAISKSDTPTNTPDSKRKAEKPSKKSLKLGSSSGGNRNELGSDNEGVTGCTLMSPDNAPSMGCFGCISRKGKNNLLHSDSLTNHPLAKSVMNNSCRFPLQLKTQCG